MAEQIAPTRSNLLQRRDQLQLANRGADLLKRKRDALITEFFDLVQSSLDARRSLSGTSQEAYFSLFLANAWDGPEAVESLSLAAQSGLDVDIKMENLFGVKVPEVQPPSFSDDLPFSPINAGARTLDAAREFRKLTEALIKVAATETRLRRIGEEIKKTNRRVNALEQLVIPGINQQIKDIRSVLDQRALEEVTVLKRIKAKLEAREAEEKEENKQQKSSQAEGKSISEPYPDNETSMAETVKDIEEVGVVEASEQSDVDEREGQKETVSAAASSTAQSGASTKGAATKDSATKDAATKAAKSASVDTARASSASGTANKIADTKADSASTAGSKKGATNEGSSNSSQQAKESVSAKDTSAETASSVAASSTDASKAEANTSPKTPSRAEGSEATASKGERADNEGARATTTDTTDADTADTDKTAAVTTSKSAKAETPQAASANAGKATQPEAKGTGSAKAASSSDGVLLGAEADKYITNLEKYTSDVNGNVVRAILRSFGDAVNDRDAMTVACAQPKELRYIKRNLLRGRLSLESPDEVLDKALQDVCEQMGRSNRNKSSVTFYYLLSEKFAKLPVWLA